MLDGESTLNQSYGDWPLSVYRSSFDYLQVICGWIKFSPLKFQFCHVKGHQTNSLRYDQLDWWAKCNEDIDQSAKWFLLECTIGLVLTRQRMSNLNCTWENRLLLLIVLKLQVLPVIWCTLTSMVAVY